MKKYPIFSGKGDCLLLGFFLTAMLYLNRDSLFCLFDLGFYNAMFCLLGVICIVGLLFLLRNRHSLKQILWDIRIPWCAFLSVLFLLPMLIKRDWQLMYFSMLLCVLLAVFLTYFTDRKKVAESYVWILAFFSVVSVLATYIIRIPADHGILVPPILEGADGDTFYEYYLANVSIEYVKNRNYGIFREPGVHQYFLLIALYLTNYSVEWKRPSQKIGMNVLFTVTMLSTFATGGVIELGLFLAVLYFEQKWYRTKQGKLWGAGIVAGGVLALTVIIIQHGALYNELYLMMVKFVNGSDSITDRVGSPIVNAQFFFSSPLWGRGISEVLHGIMNNTSSSTLLFAVLGLGGGLLNMLGWFALVWRTERPAIWNLALLLILAMAFNTENLITDPYFWIFPMMAMTERWLPWFAEKWKKQRG